LEYKQGALVVVSDHINLQGQNPLVGPNDDRFGPRFPDMTHAYCEEYRAAVLAAGRALGKTVQEGVYAALLGPSYETPAEIRYLVAPCPSAMHYLARGMNTSTGSLISYVAAKLP